MRSGNTLVANTANDNSGWGFGIVTGSSDNRLTGNVSNRNGNGFLVAGWDHPASGNVLDGNVANNNTGVGFGAWRATGNTWTNNTANNSDHEGFALWRDGVQRQHAHERTSRTTTASTAS